jgi:hypothetical protein
VNYTTRRFGGTPGVVFLAPFPASKPGVIADTTVVARSALPAVPPETGPGGLSADGGIDVKTRPSARISRQGLFGAYFWLALL